VNKTDFATQLLEDGLAICFGNPKNEYWSLEDEAKNNKKGLWSSTVLKLDAIRQNEDDKRTVKYIN
jgi:endonuclease YncB( thermonuclease family)